MALTLDYHVLARRFIVLPLVIILVFGSCLYLVGDLLNTMKNEVTAAQNINHLLVKTLASKNATLVSEQVQDTLARSPQYESIMYYPLNQGQTVPVSNVDIYTLLLQPYAGVNEPVIEAIGKTNEHIANRLNDNSAFEFDVPAESSQPNYVNTNSKTVGYLNLTLNLRQLRWQWLQQSLPIILTVLTIWLVTLSTLLQWLRRLVNQLSPLEKMSRRVLDDQFVFDEIEPATKSQRVQWLFEKALLHLINRQKTLTYQLDTLTQEKQRALANNAKQLRHHSNFQNTLSHELKSSIQRVEFGLQLLKNQYVSNEQEDAVNLISQGTDDLNAKLNQIIQLNRIEKGQVTIELNQLNPTQLIEEIVEPYRLIAHERSLKLSVKSHHGDYMLEGDVQKISLIINSLIENAIRFTEVGEIEILSQLNHLENNIRWSIQVRDTGTGIAKPYLKQLFEPFFQVNTDVKRSQNPQTVSLFLVKKLVDILDGDIQVTSHLNQGSTFTVHFGLHDWKDQYQRRLLKDKVVGLWGMDDTLTILHQRLVDAKASIHQFEAEDKERLLDYLLNHQVDILLISSAIAITNVLNFIQPLRDAEQNHRLLVVYYHDKAQLNAQQIEALSIEGVDYFEQLQNPPTDIDNYMKRLIQYLN